MVRIAMITVAALVVLAGCANTGTSDETLEGAGDAAGNVSDAAN